MGLSPSKLIDTQLSKTILLPWDIVDASDE